MDILGEFLIELVFEGAEALCSHYGWNPKVSRWVRYPLLGILALFYLSVIGVCFAAGVLVLPASRLLGVMLLILGVVFLFLTVRKGRKMYRTYMEKKESEYGDF